MLNVERSLVEPETVIIDITPDKSVEMAEELREAPDPNEDLERAIGMGLAAAAKALGPEGLQTLIEFASNPEAPGVALLTGLPVDPVLGPTPAFGEPSTEKRTHITETALVGITSYVGRPYAFAQEKKGRPVHDVVPQRHKKTSHSNAGYGVDLGLHTEAAALGDASPEYLGLYGVKQDEAKEACTITADIRDAVHYLDASDLELLRGPNFRLQVPESFAENGMEMEIITPVISGPAATPQVVVNMDRMTGITSKATAALKALEAAFGEVKRQTWIRPGDLVIIANRRAVHGRSIFTPRFDGHDRWLQRTYVTSSLWPLRGRAGRSYRVLSAHDED